MERTDVKDTSRVFLERLIGQRIIYSILEGRTVGSSLFLSMRRSNFCLLLEIPSLGFV